MGWATPKPYNSHLSTPTWAAAISGIVLLNIAVLLALMAIGPLDCNSQMSGGGFDPRTGQMRPMDTQLNCDPGITPEEMARVSRLSFIGIALVFGAFVLGTVELALRIVKNVKAGEEAAPTASARRD